MLPEYTQIDRLSQNISSANSRREKLEHTITGYTLNTLIGFRTHSTQEEEREKKRKRQPDITA